MAAVPTVIEAPLSYKKGGVRWGGARQMPQLLKALAGLLENPVLSRPHPNPPPPPAPKLGGSQLPITLVLGNPIHPLASVGTYPQTHK